MNTLSEPWYRHRWPWFLMIGPAAAVLAGIATIWLAVVSDDGLVAEDYYKQGMAINRTLSREKAAQDQGLQARVSMLAESGRVQVALHSMRQDGLPAALRLRVVHPTRAGGDQNILLNRDAQGGYTGLAQFSLTGRRTLILEDAAQTWRLVGATDAAHAQHIELRPY